jgi:ribosomal protein L29
MKFKELKTKNDKELEELLNKTRDDLQTIKFKVASRQLKDVREVRVAKKLISQILTLKKQLKIQPKI